MRAWPTTTSLKNPLRHRPYHRQRWATAAASDPSEEAVTDGMTWRQVMGIIGFIAGLLLTIVSISNPDQAWSLVQKPLIAVSVGMGAWLFFFSWPARWNWAIGSLGLLVGTLLLLAESPWMEAIGLASLGLGARQLVRLGLSR